MEKGILDQKYIYQVLIKNKFFFVFSLFSFPLKLQFLYARRAMWRFNKRIMCVWYDPRKLKKHTHKIKNNSNVNDSIEKLNSHKCKNIDILCTYIYKHTYRRTCLLPYSRDSVQIYEQHRSRHTQTNDIYKFLHTHTHSHKGSWAIKKKI